MVATKCVGSWTLLAAVSLAGCSSVSDGGDPKGSEGRIAQLSDALTGQNGIWKNSLSTNGIWRNGLWQNGIWKNGIWKNGIWENGIWKNGIWKNGVWENGIWKNGIWKNGIWKNGVSENGIWKNGIWENGIWENGIWKNGLAGDMLKSNQYARQLLQYMYACAMPGVLDPETNTPIDAHTYDTTLDPNDGALTCDVAAPACDAGYTCSPEGKCVVPLSGSIGVGVNADGTTWWGSGTCDESCQRWVSACVLARTNAYGVKVDISMRAPDDAPQAIKNALAVTDDEKLTYPLREGAFFGNLFAATPLNTTVPAGFSGTTDDPEIDTPTFYACAGPGSNIPSVTRRFCSSQGDWGPITVTGICTDVCQGMSDPAAGAMSGCAAPDDTYHEVITVYLKTPLAVCGNAVCEDDGSGTSPETTATCPSDCHPGSWARALPDVELSTAVGPDGSTVFAAIVWGDIDLGGGTLPGSGARDVVVAKYAASGEYLWGKRFAVAGVFGTTALNVDAQGTVSVAAQRGFATSDRLWLARLTAGGDLVEGWPISVGGAAQFSATSGYPRITMGLELASDSDGHLIVASHFGGPATFGELEPVTSGASVVLEVSDTGVPLWAVGLGTNFPESIAIAPNGDVLLLEGFNAIRVHRLLGGEVPASCTGTPLECRESWSKAVPSGAYGVAADAQGEVYVTGSFQGFDFGAGAVFGNTGGDFFLAKYSADGTTLRWVTQAEELCVAPATRCSGRFDGLSVSFDADGNVVVGGYGGILGGAIDFGAGPFESFRTQDAFVVGFRPSTGAVGWAKQVPMVLNGLVSDVTVDASGAVHVAGRYSGSMQVDDQLLVTADPQDPGVYDTFVASFQSPSMNDITPPVIDHLSESTTVQATSTQGAAAWFLPPTAIDEGFAGTNVVCDPKPNTTLPIGTTSVTCTAYDPVGNASAQTFSITVVDTLPPLITNVPAPAVTNATSASGAVVTYSLIEALDQVDGVRAVTCDHASGDTYPIGTTVVSCSATDTRGNTSQATFAITVDDPLDFASNPPDTTPPVIPPPSAMTTAQTTAAGAVVTYEIAVTDDVGVTSVDCTPPSGSVFPLGETTVSCSASDAAGHVSTSTFTVTVADETEPVITPPSSVAVGDTTAAGAVATYDASASDNVGVTDFQCTPPSGSVFPLGDTTVSCTASDAAGKQSTRSFVISVADKTKPVLALPAGLTVEATSSSGANVSYDASATDNVGVAGFTCSPPLGGAFPLGTTTVTCSASDAAGNLTQGSFDVSVLDQTPPALTLPDSFAVQATSTAGAIVTYDASALDAVDGSFAPTCIPASGSLFPLGTTTVTCSADDVSDNVTTASFEVSVTDKVAPAMVLPAAVTATATTTSGAVVSYSATALDLFDGAIVPTCTSASGSQFAPGTTLVSCSATDSNGNTATASFPVQVSFAWGGALQPIEADGSSIFKLGSTVPVKFQLAGESAGIANLNATLTLTKVSSAVTGTSNEAVSTASASSGNTFRYDATTGQYMFNLSTKGLSVGTWMVSIDLGDGVSRTATFSLKK